MRSGGINWLAVIAAAVTIYVLGFVMYAVMIPMESYVAMSGITEAEQATATSRMMYSPIMPIMTAVFMAVLFKWGSVPDMVAGIPGVLYGWVYDGANNSLTMIDCAHLLLGHMAAGGILGGWK